MYFCIIHKYLLHCNAFLCVWNKKELKNIFIFTIGNKILLSIKLYYLEKCSETNVYGS